MNKSEIEIKEAVKTGYTEALNRSKSGGCCGGSSVEETMKGELVKFAGYSAEELKVLPSDSVENSFGCGNPLAFTGVKKGDTVVDIGSGAGIDCLLAAEKVGPEGKVIGIDMTPAMIERARENARRAGKSNVEFRLGDADRMPVDSSTVDWIISNCVINLAPDKDKVFQEVYRVLKPGGQISISDIVTANALPEPIRENLEALVGCIAGALTETDYLAKMRNAGLTGVKVTDRLVYSKEQIQSLFSVDGSCGCGPVDLKLFEPFMDEIDGKIWSAKISARKL